jgi:hypothetical protein
VNATYLEMAAHYSAAVIPARARKPRDKAGVLVVERWILASLRNRHFHSLAELNAAIRERLGWLNRRPFMKLEGCRLSLFVLVPTSSYLAYGVTGLTSSPAPRSASTRGTRTGWRVLLLPTAADHASPSRGRTNNEVAR